MPRIAGINIDGEKQIIIGLTAIFGIGRSLSAKICQSVGIHEQVKLANLSSEDLTKVRAEVAKYQIEGDLRREIAMNIKRLIDIHTYRGLRHRRSLPVRGQRTRTNAMTRKKGKKRTG